MDFSQFAILPVVLLGRQIDFEDETNLLMLRIAFGTVVFITSVVVLYLKNKMSNTQLENKHVEVSANPSPFNSDGEKEKITYEEHDAREFKKFLQKVGMPIVICIGIHYYAGIAIPLLIQAIMIPMNIYKSPLVKFYILGEHVTRPFPPPPSPFGNIGKLMEDMKDDGEDKPKKKKKVQKKPTEAEKENIKKNQ
eukprot:TRINITY_DN11766_c0_g1_i1.p1 TRINITY_DN11766_c0_g1~~TRINITY_DN11766_c0_g1_i1.p1  ORF type:complete len:194 (-),score=57.52 TRINITY_DN11766_c0_g1_i1:60-641(-)